MAVIRLKIKAKFAILLVPVTFDNVMQIFGLKVSTYFQVQIESIMNQIYNYLQIPKT